MFGLRLESIFQIWIVPYGFIIFLVDNIDKSRLIIGVRRANQASPLTGRKQIMRTFHDIENDVIITEAELQAEYEELWQNDETCCESFEVYVRECTGKNGTLEVIEG